MRYLLAVLLPPLAVFQCRSGRQLALNLLLTACLWVPGVLHALVVVRAAAVRERTDRVADVVLALEERLAQARRQHRPARATPIGRSNYFASA